MNADLTLFGVELRRRRLAAALSLAELARRVHYSKSHLSKVETGSKPPSVDLARQCDAVLGCSGELAGLVPARASRPGPHASDDEGEVWVVSLGADGRGEFGTVTRRSLLAGAAGLVASTAVSAPSAHPDPGTLESFRSMFADTRALGQRLAPARLIPMIVAQTHSLRSIAVSARPPLRDAAFVLAARFAEYAGWMAQESGDDRWAMWWTDQAAELAEAGGDREFTAYTLVRRALVTLYRHDGSQTVALAREAMAMPASRRVRALAAQREAQGHAILGDYDECRRALDRAASLLPVSETSDGMTIGSTHVADPIMIATGWCLFDLGRPASAAEVLQRELGRIPIDAHRARARYGVRLAHALASSGDLEQACAVTESALQALERTDSATVRVDLRGLAHTLNRWHAEPVARHMMPRLAAALRTPLH